MLRQNSHAGTRALWLKVTLAPLAIDFYGVHGVLKRGSGHGVRVDIEGFFTVVVKGVAGQMVARIILIPRCTAPERYFLGGLDPLGSGKEPASRDTNRDDGAIVREQNRDRLITLDKVK